MQMDIEANPAERKCVQEFILLFPYSSITGATVGLMAHLPSTRLSVRGLFSFEYFRNRFSNFVKFFQRFNKCRIYQVDL